MGKHYKLIVGHDFSLSNETDADPMSDYNPGIWCIPSQKRALAAARRLMAEGSTITVTDYENPRYHAVANKLITELGLSQPLFTEPEALQQGPVTSGKPSTLSQLKKYLVEGTKLTVMNFDSDGVTCRNERKTFVKRVQTNAVVLDKNGGDSWLEFGKASEWLFFNDSATKYYIEREGKFVPTTKIVY